MLKIRFLSKCLDEVRERAMGIFMGKAFQAEGIAGAKALRK